MAKFIEVTNVGSGVKSLVNTDQILEVSVDNDGNTYFEASVLGVEGRKASVVTYRLTCQERYETIKRMLVGGEA